MLEFVIKQLSPKCQREYRKMKLILATFFFFISYIFMRGQDFGGIKIEKKEYFFLHFYVFMRGKIIRVLKYGRNNC